VKNILIADDDIISQTVLRSILGKWGYRVIVTSNGEEALMALLSKDAPQMALLDWMMPGMDGPTVCHVLRQNNRPDPLYLILVTSKGSREEIVQGLEAGADDYIIKPYDNKELMARINAGFRSLDLQMQLKEYSMNMEQLARDRANQLVRSDRMAALGVMSASVAHEINNPATFVSINVQVLEENWPILQACISGTANEEQKKRAQLISEEIPTMFTEIKNGISRIKDIVDSMKAYARSDKVNFMKTSLETCIDEALKLCWNKLKYIVTVNRNIPGDLPQIIVDARRLEQVFINLFINAADAMEMEGIQDGQLDISAHEKQNSIVMTVRDSGPGIPEKYINKLFSPFFTTKQEGKGTGLGLLISRGIIKDHGGTLTARNAEQGGAEFTITLPKARSGGLSEKRPASDSSPKGVS
jgi:two-component system, NtrC family, sensor kinase